MKRYLCGLLLIAAAFFSSCSENENKELEEALSWSADDGIAFDNWKQINADFGWTKEEFYSQEWVPRPVDVVTGKEIPGEVEKDNFRPWTGRFIPYAQRPGHHMSRLGFEYPDLVWEAQDKNVSVFKLSSDYNKRPLEELMAELLYEKESYRGCTVYSGGKEPGIYFERDLGWMENVKVIAYCEAEKILLISHDSAHVRQTIDAHFDGKSLLEKDGIREIAGHLDGIESGFIGPQPVELKYLLWSTHSTNSLDVRRADFLTETGLNNANLAALHKPVCLAAGERKGGEVISVLQFAGEDDAEADLETRRAIFEKGRSWRDFGPLREIFSETDVRAEGTCIVFGGQMRPCSNALFDMFATLDLAWAINPG
jgi:hypothetical protein